MLEPLVLCDNLVKIYKVADLEVVALQGLDPEVLPGEMMAIVGVSGSGKTTLLNILSSLDVPSAGKCVVDGNDLTRLSQAQRIRYERFTVGHVWQQSGRNLLPELSIQDNVELPQVLGGVSSTRRARRATELLELVGLGDMGKKRPDQLSGGEQQRAAIAVALANEPKLLLGDEPTGELDSISAHEILTQLRTLNRQLGLTIIIVTHDVAIAALVDRTIAIRDGRTSTETVRRDAPLETVSEHTLATSAVIGLPCETHRESVVIDRAGRLQLPKEALENVEIPLRLALTEADQREKLAYDALKRVGLAQRAHHRDLELSGGEQQRVALARALVHSPRFIVADEPTGNLDSVTGRDIAKLLRETAQHSQIGLLVATHDSTIVEAADRVLSIQDGRIVD